MKYRLSKMGDGWEFLPKEEKESKFQFERIVYNISRREKMICRVEEDLKRYKLELREWKKTRTELHRKLLKYHKEFSPTFSISISKKGKLKPTDVGDFLTGGNKSWTITILISGERKQIYLGRNKDVCRFLDKIENKSEYWEYKPEKIPRHEIKIKNLIEKYIIPEIRKEMVQRIESSGSIIEFWEEEQKGSDYMDIVLKSKVSI